MPRNEPWDWDHPGFRLTAEQRRQLSNRLMVQPPGSADRILEEKKINGFPVDVLLTLGALELLAAQGNAVAQQLYEHERLRFGLTNPTIFVPRG